MRDLGAKVKVGNGVMGWFVLELGGGGNGRFDNKRFRKEEGWERRGLLQHALVGKVNRVLQKC